MAHKAEIEKKQMMSQKVTIFNKSVEQIPNESAEQPLEELDDIERMIRELQRKKAALMGGSTQEITKSNVPVPKPMPATPAIKLTLFTGTPKEKRII